MKPDLPNGWIFTTIGDIVSFEYGKGLPANKRDSRGTVPVYGSNGIVGYHATALVKEPCLIIGRKGAAGAVHKSENPCWPIDTTYYVIPPADVNLTFIYYLFSSLELVTLDRSTAIPGLNRNDAYDIKITLPPLLEQQRIVAKIEELFTQLGAGVAALKRVQAALKRYKASVLKAAVDGRLVEQDPNDEPAEEFLKRFGKKPLSNENLGALPNGWCWTSLPDMGELARGKSKHRPRNAPFLYGGQYPFVQTGDIRQASGIIASFSQTYSEAGLRQSRLWPKGTLCITIAANIADTAILGFDACFPDSVVGFIPVEGIDVLFIQYFISTIKEDLERYAPATAQKNINIKTLQKVAIPLPPLAEQQRIVNDAERKLSVVQVLQTVVEKTLRRSDRLIQTILAQAFQGGLVTQNPEDEPAAKLLERIRAARGLEEARKKAERPKKEKKKVTTDKKRQPFYNVLMASGVRLTPEQLFSSAGFNEESVDEFYQELREEEMNGRIKIHRPNQADVYLESISP